MDFVGIEDSDDVKYAKLLLEQETDINQSDDGGRTLLYKASMKGHLDVVRYLVEHGATLDHAESKGGTPLYIAAAYGHLEICRYLLEQGADRDKANCMDFTPLHIACNQNKLEIAILLMRYGADLNARSNEASFSRLPIDCARNDEIRQAILDEPRRRIDEAPGKRAVEQDWQSIIATSTGLQQEEGNETTGRLSGEEEQEVETKVAEEDEDSEPSDEEEDNTTRKG